MLLLVFLRLRHATTTLKVTNTGRIASRGPRDKKRLEDHNDIFCCVFMRVLIMYVTEVSTRAIRYLMQRLQEKVTLIIRCSGKNDSCYIPTGLSRTLPLMAMKCDTDRGSVVPKMVSISSSTGGTKSPLGSCLKTSYWFAFRVVKGFPSCNPWNTSLSIRST